MPRSGLHPAPASKSPEISPESLRQIIVINNKLPPWSHSPHLPGGKQTELRTLSPRQLNPDRAVPAADRLFSTAFVCLFLYFCSRGGLSSQSSGCGAGTKQRTNNYMWFGPSWGIMGRQRLIGRDKPDCEWALMSGLQEGWVCVLSIVSLL